MFQQEKGESTEFTDALTGRKHFEAHGDRWASLDENDALALAVLMDRLFQRGGFTVEGLPGRYDMLIQPSGDCRAAALVSENEAGEPGIDSVYPVLLGRRSRLRVEHIHEWAMPVHAEAELYAESPATGPLTFFEPFYCRDREALEALKVSGGEADFTALADPLSQDVVRLVEQFPDILKSAVNRSEPSMVTRFAVDLAQAFNKFYYENKVMVDEPGTRAARLLLTDAARQTLKVALYLIGVEAPERM